MSADLRERQRATLAAQDAALLERVRWIDAPPTETWDGVMVANEVLDALPVERFRVTPAGYESIGVVAEGRGVPVRAPAGGSGTGGGH